MLHFYLVEVSRNLFASFRVFQYTTLMRTNRRVFSFCLVIFAPMLTGVDLSAALSAPAKPAPAKDAPPGVGATSTDVYATLPDPKRPGKLLYALRYRTGSFQSGDTGLHGTLTTVSAKLFQLGVASATLTAPHALISSVSKVVVVTGEGGVVVHSLTQPGTILTADTVIWYATLNKMVATGHVYYHDGKTGATMTGPRAVGDTRLKTLTITAGHGTMNF